MSNKISLLKELSSKDLQIHESHLESIDNEKAFEELRALIIRRVEELIDADFPYLMHLLYRADVNETQLKIQLNEQKDSDPAEVIADAYIQRQLGKLKTRGAGDSDWDFDI